MSRKGLDGEKLSGRSLRAFHFDEMDLQQAIATLAAEVQLAAQTMHIPRVSLFLFLFSPSSFIENCYQEGHCLQCFMFLRLRESPDGSSLFHWPRRISSPFVDVSAAGRPAYLATSNHYGPRSAEAAAAHIP